MVLHFSFEERAVDLSDEFLFRRILKRMSASQADGAARRPAKSAISKAFCVIWSVRTISNRGAGTFASTSSLRDFQREK